MDEDYRSLCQVFTPEKNVKQLLDWCGYKKDLYGKKIIENSFGDGQILKEIIKRYIEDGLNNGISKENIKIGLQEDIYGIEYDRKQYIKCIENLNVVAKEYGIENVEWMNIKKGDTLKRDYTRKFDFVVGNPPYIKYKSLSIKDRKYVKNKFVTCKDGKFDYCYAFIESSINSLRTGGQMAYLIPSSIFKNVFAEALREYMKPHIVKIYDYTVTKLFDKETNDKQKDRLTSSAIMILEKDSNIEELEYIDITKKSKIKIDKTKLQGKWIFSNKEIDITNRLKFGDYFNASNTIATLYNNAYIIKEYTEDKQFIYPKCGGRVEKGIVKDTVSPKTFNKSQIEKLIFPYYYENSELLRYDEKEFEKKFENTCKYLKQFEKGLNNRNSDKSARWFEYGRGQALRNGNKEKLLLSTVITNEVKTRILPKDNIPYSGIYIIAIKDKKLEEAEKILKSKEFFEYISNKGINASGNSLRITAKDINEFMF